MFRLVGAVMLLFGTGGYSVCCCRDMHRRLHCLYEMKRMFEIFYSQIGYCAADFPETCKMAECYMESPFSEMLHAVSEEAEKNTGKPIPRIWEEQVKSCFLQSALKKEDKALLMELSRSLGCADKELQKQAINNQSAALCAKIQKTETHMAEREKMVMSLGIMGGLLLVIILL